jgi:hypothetical protein
VWLLVGCGASGSPAPRAAQAEKEPAKTAASTPAAALSPTPGERAAAEAKPESTGESALAAAEPETGAAGATAAPPVPTTCAGSAKRCVPPPSFSRQLCRGRFPSLALQLFEKHAPWEHLYVRAEELDPVNSYGGPRSDSQLEFGEEVVLLKAVEQGGRGGFSVSGASDVDILRLDGTCATIREEMLVRYVPGAVKSAPVIWKFLDDGTQHALLADRRVERAQKNEQKACRGMSVNQRNEECSRVRQALNDAILLTLRKGISLPAPDKIPRWSE